MSVSVSPRALGITVLFAMPIRSMFGGMATYAAILQRSSLFAGETATVLDTSPPRAPYGLWRRIVHALATLWTLVRSVKRNRPRVLYIMSSDYLGFYEKGAMIAIVRRIGCKVVLHLMGDYAVFYRRAHFTRWLQRLVLRQCDGVIVVSRSSALAVEAALPGDRVFRIPNPVDVSQFAGALRSRSENTVQVLFVGAVVRDKGVFDLIRATAQLRSSKTPVRVVIAGDGEDAVLCRQQVAEGELTDFVQFLGLVDEKTKVSLLANSDVFVLPTYSEGIPIALLEAMAVGLPVVSTYAGGIPDVISHDENGLLMHAGDVDALAGHLRRLAADRALRRRLGARASALVSSEFRSELIVDRLRSCLEQVGGI